MLLHFLIIHQTLGFIIITIGMMIEGDIILFTAGFLSHRGVFNVDTLLLMVFLSVILGDNLWYVFGETLLKRESRLYKFIERLTSPFDEHLKNKTARTIFIAKFAYGLYRPILLRAGSQRLSFKKFITGDLIATTIWIAIIGGLGYLSSASFLLIRRYLRYTELTLLLAILIFILISHIITKISKKEL